MVILYQVKLANSVIQYIFDEMNAYRLSDYVYRQRNAEGGAGQLAIDLMSYLDTARQFHTDDGWQGDVWNALFFGGGEWDHKPRIRPVWGQTIG